MTFFLIGLTNSLMVLSLGFLLSTIELIDSFLSVVMFHILLLDLFCQLY